MTDTAAKKDIQKLQRLIVDALEDVKAQDLKVFDTEHLSPLFERVIIASGTSNRQTKALAASVRDKVREAGFGKPRIEGEDNGEWIIADCGAAVVPEKKPAAKKAPVKKTAAGKSVTKTPAKKAATSSKAPAKTAAKPAAKVALKAPAKKTAAKKVVVNAPAKTVAKKAVAKKTTPAPRKLVKPATRKSS